MKRYLPVFATVVVALIAYFLFSSNSAPDNNLKTNNSATRLSDDSLPVNPDTKSIELIDVSNGSSTGMATVLRNNGTLFHIVEAKLPPLNAGQAYEGWLVRKTPTLDFFSTGVMTSEGNGDFSLIYENLDDDFPSHNQVVITLETIVDETPETHILEGSF